MWVKCHLPVLGKGSYMGISVDSHLRNQGWLPGQMFCYGMSSFPHSIQAVTLFSLVCAGWRTHPSKSISSCLNLHHFQKTKLMGKFLSFHSLWTTDLSWCSNDKIARRKTLQPEVSCLFLTIVPLCNCFPQINSYLLEHQTYNKQEHTSFVCYDSFLY